jgi:AraC-like DNA-binding protein
MPRCLHHHNGNYYIYKHLLMKKLKDSLFAILEKKIPSEVKVYRIIGLYLYDKLPSVELIINLVEDKEVKIKFFSRYGDHIRQIHIARKMEAAYREIESNPDITRTEVRDMFGYSSSPAFNRALTIYTGKNYRKIRKSMGYRKESVPRGSIFDKEIEKAKLFMDRSESKVILIRSLAKRAGASMRTFINRFKIIYGEPPSSYMKGIRMAKALSIIQKDPYISLSRVGLQLGYKSKFLRYEQFCRDFKRYNGITVKTARMRAPEMI